MKYETSGIEKHTDGSFSFTIYDSDGNVSLEGDGFNSYVEIRDYIRNVKKSQFDKQKSLVYN